VQGTAEKWYLSTKNHKAGAQPLLSSLKLLFGDVLVAVAVMFCVRAWTNDKCLATKHHQTLFGDQTFYHLDTFFGTV